MGVPEELEALRHRGVTTKNASKLQDASGLSTPQAEAAAIQAERERIRSSHYGRAAEEHRNAYNEAKLAVQGGGCDGVSSPTAVETNQAGVPTSPAVSPATPQKNGDKSTMTNRKEPAMTASATTAVNDSSSSSSSSSMSQSEESTRRAAQSPLSATATTSPLLAPPPTLESSSSPFSSQQPENGGTGNASSEVLVDHDEEPNGAREEEEQAKTSSFFRFGLEDCFLVDVFCSQAVLATFVISLLLSFSLGMTVSIVPEILTDRYARLRHGYDREGALPPCWDYTVSTMPAACVRGADDAQTGTAYAMLAQNLLTFFCNAVCGSYSDTLGRRPFLRASIFFNALVPAALVATQVVEQMDPVWYFAANAATGIISFPSMIFAVLSDDCPPEHRAGRFAINLAGFYFGFAFGPMAPMYRSHTVVSWWSFGLAAVMMVVSLVVLPETLPELAAATNSRAAALEEGEQGHDGGEDSLVEQESWINVNSNSATSATSSSSPNTTASKVLQAMGNLVLRPFREMTILARDRVLQLVAIGSFLAAAVYNIDNTLVLFYIEDYLNVREDDLAGMFLVMGVMGALLQGIGLQPLVSRLGELRLLVITFVSGTVHNFLYGAATNKAEITLALSLSQFTKLSYPLLSSLASKQVGLDEQGRVQGALLGLNALAGAIAPVSMNWVYERTKDGTHKPFGPGTMFLLSSGLYLTGAMVTSRIPSSTDAEETETETNTRHANDNNNTTPRSGADESSDSFESSLWVDGDLEEPLLLRLGETITI